MKKNKKILLGMSILFILLVATLVLLMIPKVHKLNDFMENLVIEDINLNLVQDGEYYGNIDAGLIEVELEVVVREDKITDINLLKHKNGQGEAANQIVEFVIQEQSLEVDTISGATLSSQVILKTIEEAVEDGYED
jgi:uncharacterized protein with FMN-binding domain